ncbi:MAG: hypothetical protein R3F02_15075 [Thiolinea sp.]
MKTLKTALTTTVLALGMTMGNAAFALGDACNDFDIRVRNLTGSEIKVTKVEYADYDRGIYRTEIRGNQRIDQGDTHVWERRLAHVDNDRTNLRVSYRVKRPNRVGFYPERTINSGDFICRDHGSRFVTIR